MTIKMVGMVFSPWVSVSPEFIMFANSSASLHKTDWSILGVEEEKQKFLVFLHYFIWSYVSYLLSAMK